jgi:hypothetical protein
MKELKRLGMEIRRREYKSCVAVTLIDILG